MFLKRLQSIDLCFPGILMSVAIDTTVVASLLTGLTDIASSTVTANRGDETILELGQRVRESRAFSCIAMRAALTEMWPSIGWLDFKGSPRTWRETVARSCWIYEPIDRGTHFLHHVPFCSSSLTLIERGRPVLTFAYDPVLGDLYVARDGKGASRNGSAVKITNKCDIGSALGARRSALVGTSVPPFNSVGERDFKRSVDLLERLSRTVFSVRQFGSPSLQLAYVAAGRLDGYVEIGSLDLAAQFWRDADCPGNRSRSSTSGHLDNREGGQTPLSGRFRLPIPCV